MNFLNDEFRIWKGKWIWGENKSIKNSYYYFRKELEISDNKDLKILITADTRYKLYVNGQYVGYGPIQSQPFCTYYDTWDISNYLHQGINVIGIIGYYSGHLKQTRGGVLAEVVNSMDEVVLATDKTWKTMRSTAWEEDAFSLWINRYAPSQEFFDAEKEPEGWAKINYTDDTWHNAVVIKGNYSDIPPAVAPWSLIRKRPIPFMTDISVNIKDIVSVGECLNIENRFRQNDLSISLSQGSTPTKLTQVKDMKNLISNKGYATVKSVLDGTYGGIYNPTFIVDFGRVITAFFEMELEGNGGESVEIGYAERLVDGNFNNALECQFADKYTFKKGRQIFRSFNWRGYRYVKLIFKNCTRDVKIHNIKGIVSTYPFNEVGNFESSEEKLNKVFDICRYTLRLCSNESILDTPWREQSQWVGDASAVTIGGIYACFGDTKLPGKYIQQSAGNQYQTGFMSNMTNIVDYEYQSSMIDYNLWWIICIWNQYMYTGDESWINNHYPVVSKMIMSFFNYVDEYGMLNHIPYMIFIDWANHDRKGENTAVNALFYGTLMKVHAMAALKNDQHMIQETKSYMKLLKSNFVNRFFNKEIGCFVEGNYENIQSDEISETANMLSIYFDLCESETSDEIVNKLIVKKSFKKMINAEPFMSLYTLKALHKIGKTELAIEVIIDRWYKRMVEMGANSTWEEWSQNGSYRNGEFSGFFRSHSHSWSAGPAEFLIKYLGGIEIIKPGCKKVSINPAKVSFDYHIKYPIVQGVISIEKKGNDIIFDVPKGIEVI